MGEQHFVYAEFVTPDDATRAVTALVDGSFDPDEIDVLSVRDGEVQRVPIRHHRPVLAGAVLGVLFGMLTGLSVGLLATSASADAWSTATRWILLGAAAGFLCGGLGGLVWWRSGVRITGALSDAQRFVVGTIVNAGRTVEVESILATELPLRTGHYVVTGPELARQHADRLVVPTP